MRDTLLSGEVSHAVIPTRILAHGQMYPLSELSYIFRSALRSIYMAPCLATCVSPGRRRKIPVRSASCCCVSFPGSVPLKAAGELCVFTGQHLAPRHRITFLRATKPLHGSQGIVYPAGMVAV